ncbi:MAG: hypothetical protein ABFR82_11170 [Nitrospirota bacterium]
MKVVTVEHKGIVPDTVEHRGNIKLKTRLRLSEYVFREVDYRTDNKKKAIEDKMGSHSLSELHHFKSYHK